MGLIKLLKEIWIGEILSGHCTALPPPFIFYQSGFVSEFLSHNMITFINQQVFLLVDKTLVSFWRNLNTRWDKTQTTEPLLPWSLYVLIYLFIHLRQQPGYKNKQTISNALIHQQHTKYYPTASETAKTNTNNVVTSLTLIWIDISDCILTTTAWISKQTNKQRSTCTN